MGKRFAFAVCMMGSAALVGLGVWTYLNHRLWLRAHRLDGFLLLLLIFAGGAALALALQVRANWADLSTDDMLRLYARRGGLMLLVFTAISAAFALAGFALDLFAQRPWLTLISLLLLTPLVLTGIDMARNKIPRRPRNLALGYAYYALAAWYILGVQALFIPLLFLTGPVALILAFLTVADGAARLIPSLPVSGDPILCKWTHIGPPLCAPGLAVFFILYAILAWLVFRYHDQALDFFADGYQVGKETLSAMMRET